MADDIRLVIGVDDKGLLKAIRSTETLEGKVKKLSDAYSRGAATYGRYNRAIEKLAEETGRSKTELLKYATALRASKKAQEEATAAERKARQETKEYVQARREAVAEERRRADNLKAMKTALEAQRKSEEENTNAVKRLRSSYDAEYAAEQRRLELKRRLRQEILNGNMTLREAGAELLKYRTHMQQFNMAQMATTKTSNRLGVVTQQAGYQIGDFLVQVQSGTNFMVAFGQQATQLVGVLPLLAPKGGTFLGMGARTLIGLSAGLGIVIPLLTAFGAYFIRSGESADKAAEKIRTTADVLKDLKEATKEATVELRLLQGAFKNALEIEAVDDINEVTKKIEDLDARIAVVRQGALYGFGAAAGTMSGEELQALVNIGLDAQTESLQKEKEALEATLQKLKGKEKLVQIEEDYLALLEEVTEAEADAQASYRDRVKSLTIQNNLLRIQREYGEDSVRESDYRIQLERERLEALRAQGLISQEQLDTEMQLVIEGEKLTRGLTESEAKASALAEALKEAASAMSGLSSFGDSLDKAIAVSLAKVQALKSGVNAAVAGEIAGKRADLSSRAQQGLASGVPIGTIMAEVDSSSAKISELEALRLEEKRLEEANRKSRGGGGKSEENRMEQFIQSLMTERETLENWRSEQLDLLQQYNETELSVIGGQAEAKFRIEQEYADRAAKIRAQERSTRLTETSGMFSALAAVAATGGKRMLKVQATLSAAAATVAAYETAIKAAAEAKTIPGRIAAYASFLATGLGAVAQIRAAGGIGGGGGASGAAAAIPPAAESAAPQRVIIEGIDRNSLISGEQLSNIFEALYKENENRGFVFEVAR